MQLSISNIGWEAALDHEVYKRMQQYRYSGLEIAPTRIFPENPYEQLEKAKGWSESLNREYGFCVPSMQSIWFGRSEMLFGSSGERKILLDYTKKAIDFATAIGCKNLVFGCPRNRNLPQNVSPEIALSFFRDLGEYAYAKGTVIGMEANPPIYHTNYINDTLSALELVKQVNSKGFLLNLDIGTMIQNGESLDILKGQIRYVNHVHISEPNLKVIQERDLHKQLVQLLEQEKYSKYVSIEMSKTENLQTIENVMKYVRTVFA